MKNGKFVVLEGGEGAGKSTQARMLADALAADGINSDLTREPGGTTAAEKIRELLLQADQENWSPRAEALLFAAARSDHVERRIRPALEKGLWVICDRFIDSTRAYQGGGRGVYDADLMALHQFGSDGLLPDITLFLTVPPEISAARLAMRDADGPDAIGGRNSAYHTRVANRFEEIASLESERFAVIDADDTVQNVHGRIMVALAPLLDDNA